jgi:predicted Zn-ribbon and HTH transcriptional regulator
VKPIIEVLTMKTLQQSLLEVYEEEVLEQMEKYKENLHSKTKTKIIYENKKCKKLMFSDRESEGNRKTEIFGS